VHDEKLNNQMSNITTKKVRVVALIGGLLSDIPPDLKSIGNFVDVVVVDGPEALAKELPDADVLFVWDFRYADVGPLLSSAPNLRWIHVAAVGVNSVLSPELLKSKILLTNSRGVFDVAIAEYVTGLLLAHVKDLRNTFAAQQQSQWNYRTTRRLAGHRAVVVGTGSIGRRIGSTLRKLDIDVTLIGRRAADDLEFGKIRPSTELSKVVKGADYLVLAAPLTNESRGMVGADVLSALGPNGYLVNVGRGPLVIEEDLLAALQSGALGGAALDVFDIEPLPVESPLWTLPNVVVSPHMSGDYLGFEVDLMTLFAHNLKRWIAGEPLENVIDQSRGYVVSA
jgi:phosphoglycerate dehydrogenase-like enzyme